LLAAGALFPVQSGARRRRGTTSDGDAWRFALDGSHRWSLTRGHETAVAGAGIAVALDAHDAVPLHALEDVRTFRTGARRGGTTNVVGRTAGVEIAVQFEDGAIPTVAVRVRGLDTPRTLIAVHFTDGVTVRQDRALINGYQSWSSCQVTPVQSGTDATGHWQIALFDAASRGSASAPGLALGFGEEDAGAGEFRLTGRSLDACARFVRRPVSVDLPPASATLTIVPGPDPLAALGALAQDAAGPVAPQVPAGWCSWYELYAQVTEDDVVANVAVAREHFDPRAFRFIQLDDGYQRAAGDWETNVKFPHGHRWLTDHIHAAGFQAGLWLAPFAVTAASGIPTAHPDWILLGDDGRPLTMDVQPHWGGPAFGLDASRRDVQDWLRDMARHAVDAWGYDYLKLDFLHYGARGGRPERGGSPHEALRAGLKALRQGAGRAYLLGCGAPLQHALGQFDGMRIGSDVDATFDGIQPGARAALQRAHYHRRAWHNDPDALVVRAPLTLAEARAWTSVVALSGGVTMASDHLPRLGADRLELLQRAMPVAPVAARALDLARAETLLAPALATDGRALVALPRRWRFRPGDEPAWAAADFDDGAWEEIDVGVNWERAGHEELDGFAWYRTRFTAPRRAPGGPLALELGRIDDADETYLNGRRLGGTGTLPPDYHEAWQAWRRYPVPPDAVRWGSENSVAVRVYDGGGAGGMWSLRRDRPPTQLLARTADDRWMVAFLNWDDEPRRETIDLAAHGAAGAFATFDVWEETRLADVQGRIALAAAPRSATVVGLCRPRGRPFVLGSSRHIVQGVIDIAEERWDARRRRLAGRSVRLDGRPYALTIALPPGVTAQSCRGGAACAIARQTRGAVRLEFAPTREDVEWEVAF
jgi:alpha-galactosidase